MKDALCCMNLTETELNVIEIALETAHRVCKSGCLKETYIDLPVVMEHLINRIRVLKSHKKVKLRIVEQS